MAAQVNKKGKRNSDVLQETSNDEFEGFSSDETAKVACSDNRKWDDMSKALKEIKASIGEVIKMQVDTNSSCEGSCRWGVIKNILNDIQDGMEYIMEMKNDVDEVKITLSDINSKLAALIERDENSIVEVHQILITLPSASIPGVEKVDKYLNGGTIFSKMKGEFSRLGGQSDKMAVAVLNKLIDKKVQGQLNWGNTGTSIQSFKNILMLIHSVCKANSSTYTEKEGNEALKSALKSARSAIN